MYCLINVLLSAAILPFILCTDSNFDKQCGNAVGCFRLPANCKAKDCDVLITYSYAKKYDLFDITISTNHKWAGFALGDELYEEEMIGIKGEVCFEKNGIVHLVSLSATKNGSPDFKSTPSEVVKLSAIKTKKGGILCRYRRSAKSANKFLTSLESKVYAFYAFGDKIQNNGFPAYHGYGSAGHTVKATNLKKVMLH
ncbi:uncharacterized protein LOC124808819 isoform X1 [Hydra vulgaris]|uniref:uncharacterized protein LOC124808819 isoform X1 n=1 Tax=Hydra vulgaris TaxID=6087 RepID=UPI001F5EC99A|nr:uncharacterized protein LOC124808819 [Hydra vulgaris]